MTIKIRKALLEQEYKNPEFRVHLDSPELLAQVSRLNSVEISALRAQANLLVSASNEKERHDSYYALYGELGKVSGRSGVKGNLLFRGLHYRDVADYPVDAQNYARGLASILTEADKELGGNSVNVANLSDDNKRALAAIESELDSLQSHELANMKSSLSLLAHKTEGYTKTRYESYALSSLPQSTSSGVRMVLSEAIEKIPTDRDSFAERQDLLLASLDSIEAEMARRVQEKKVTPVLRNKELVQAAPAAQTHMQAVAKPEAPTQMPHLVGLAKGLLNGTGRADHMESFRNRIFSSDAAGAGVAISSHDKKALTDAALQAFINSNGDINAARKGMAEYAYQSGGGLSTSEMALLGIKPTQVNALMADAGTQNR